MKSKGFIMALIGVVIMGIGVGFSLFSDNNLWLISSSGIGWVLILYGAYVEYKKKKTAKR
ncbi:hypothetical protein [Maribacter sp. 2307ULW6-5]|uniref:hypothetical protein n=1 Tax=Maribacter sp. 2307ULW6-5 TaxID=3386275 RepID=UPI0039BD4343